MSRRALLNLLLAVCVIVAGCAPTGDEASGGGAESGPSKEDLRTFSKSRVFFGHQSVGNNIIDGLGGLYAGSSTEGPIVTPTSDLGSEERFLTHAMVGVNGDPQSKVDEFTSLLAGGLASKADVAVLKFCYVDVTSSSDVRQVFRAYTTAMDNISRDYPDLGVVYTTVPLGTEATWKSKLKAIVTRNVPPDTADNIAREQYNSLVREKYGSTGRLFDIARVESTREDGSRVQGEHGGRVYFALDDQIAADSGHLNDEGALLAAAEFVRVLARQNEN